jgi:hypothetical protein
MKKALLVISGFLILAFVTVLFVNAQSKPQEVKKQATEASAACGACPSATAAACATKTETKTAEVKKCDPAKCKEMGCDPAKCAEGKCDPATCKAHMADATATAKTSGSAACCAGVAKK